MELDEFHLAQILPNDGGSLGRKNTDAAKLSRMDTAAPQPIICKKLPDGATAVLPYPGPQQEK